MATSNICNYDPIINLSIRTLNNRFNIIHRYLCYLSSQSGSGGLTSVSTQNSASVTWSGDGTSGNPLIATATATATPAGANTQIQYNAAGSFGAEAAFTYNATTNTLGVDTIAATTSIGIGITPLAPLHIEGATAATSSAIFVNTDALGATSGAITGLYAKALPTAANQRLGVINFASRNGASADNIGATIEAQSNGAWTSGSSHFTRLVFSTTNSGSATPSEIMRLSNGRVSVGTGLTATAFLHLRAGAATASSAPLKLTSGTNLTTPETGAIEYNGTNLFFTRVGTTRENIVTASAVTTEIVVSDTTVTVNINGTNYKLLAVPA